MVYGKIDPRSTNIATSDSKKLLQELYSKTSAMWYRIFDRKFNCECVEEYYDLEVASTFLSDEEKFE